MSTVCVFSEGAFQTNTYICSVNNNIFVIDPAFQSKTECDSALSNIGSSYSILLTHNHLDHIRGLSFINSDVPVYIHPSDYNNLTEPYIKRAYYTYGSALFQNTEEFNLFIDQVLKIKKNMICVNENENISGAFKVIHTPGHTSGSVCYLSDTFMFSGDTLFNGSYGRYDLESGSYTDLISSIRKICALPDEIRIYPGHGDESILKHEKPLYTVR